LQEPAQWSAGKDIAAVEDLERKELAYCGGTTKKMTAPPTQQGATKEKGLKEKKGGEKGIGLGPRAGSWAHRLQNAGVAVTAGKKETGNRFLSEPVLWMKGGTIRGEEKKREIGNLVFWGKDVGGCVDGKPSHEHSPELEGGLCGASVSKRTNRREEFLIGEGEAVIRQ